VDRIPVIFITADNYFINEQPRMEFVSNKAHEKN